MTTAFLQLHGSPFTPATSGLKPKIPDGNSNKTVGRYVTVQGTITTDANGYCCILLPHNPYATPVPFMQSDMFLGGEIYEQQQTNPLSTVDTPVQINDVIKMHNQESVMYNQRFENVIYKLHANPPQRHRMIAAGVRVWNQQSSQNSQGILTGYKLDTNILMDAIIGRADMHGCCECVNWKGNVGTPENTDPLYIGQMPMGMYGINQILGQTCYGLFYGGLPSTGAGLYTQWIEKLNGWKTIAMYPNDKVYISGTDGMTMRANAEGTSFPMEEYAPRSICVPQNNAFTIPDMMCTNSMLRDPFVISNATTGTYGSIENYILPATFTYTNQTPVSAAIPVSSTIIPMIPIQQTDPPQNGARSYYNWGAAPVKTYGQDNLLVSFMAGTTAMPWREAFTDTSYWIGSPGQTRGQGVQVASLRKVLTGNDTDNRIGDVNMSSCFIEGTNFDPNTSLWVEYVWWIEEEPQNDDINSTTSPLDPNFQNALQVLRNEDAFPVIAKGHSFFTKVRDAIRKAGMAVSQYGPKIIRGAEMLSALL